MIPPTTTGRTGAQRPALRRLIATYARTDPPATIAVVGNAPLAPDPVRAQLIDSCDLVVRMTTFALDRPGHPAAAGRRADVVIFTRATVPSPFTFADYPARLYLLAEPELLHYAPAPLPRSWPADLGSVPLSNPEFIIPLIGLLGRRLDRPEWPTTGTLTTYLMTELFARSSVLLAGMSIMDDPVQRVFQHAWGPPVAVTPEHRLDAECLLLRRWVDEGRFRLLR